MILCGVVLADDYQSYPGQVSGPSAGQIQVYDPPQVQNTPPMAPQQVPGYQNPGAYIEINPAMRRHNLEECKVIAPNGTGLIKQYMADSGPNQFGDPNAWIWVPIGMCAKLNAGDYADIPPEIMDKIYYE
jgi:hypothetical protein